MSLYGIGRLLESRELGPNHLRPAIEDLGNSAIHHCAQVQVAMGQLRIEAADHSLLTKALDALQLVIDELSRELLGTFAQLKLNAAQRLALERSFASFGAQVEALRGLLALIDAAVQPHVAELSLIDLIQGGGHMPTFAAGTINVHVSEESCLQALTVDPRVWSTLFEHVLRELSAAPGDGVLVKKLDGRPQVLLQWVEEARLAAASQFEAVWPLGPPSSVEQEVVGCVAEHVHMQLERSDDTATITIGV